MLKALESGQMGETSTLAQGDHLCESCHGLVGNDFETHSPFLTLWQPAKMVLWIMNSLIKETRVAGLW